MKNEQKKNEMTFYSTRGIMLLIAAVLVFATLALIGMSWLGVISIPRFITEFFDNSVETVPAGPISNIAFGENNTVFHEALPRDEYAAALADISFPSEFYYNYTISLFSEADTLTTDYIAICKGNDWWLQTAQNDVIMSTVICKNSLVQFSDNADNSFVTASQNNISLAEYSGFMPLKDLTLLIASLTSGNEVEYGGGVSDYSLSYTQGRGGTENLFSFNFSRKDGISEEYTFALESATILSIKKYNSDGEKFYQMDMKDSRNNLDEINVESLIVLKEND